MLKTNPLMSALSFTSKVFDLPEVWLKDIPKDIEVRTYNLLTCFFTASLNIFSYVLRIVGMVKK